MHKNSIFKSNELIWTWIWIKHWTVDAAGLKQTIADEQNTFMHIKKIYIRV